MTPRQPDYGLLAVLAVAAATVAPALLVRIILSDGEEFVAGVFVGVPPCATAATPPC